MATQDFYGHHVDSRRNMAPYVAPPSPGGWGPSRYSHLSDQLHSEPPMTPTYDTTPLHPSHSDNSNNWGRLRDSRLDSDDIPLRPHPQHYPSETDASRKDPADLGENGVIDPTTKSSRRRREPEKKKGIKGFFAGKVPWVTYMFTLLQVTVFIVELVKSSILTSTPIEIQPQINPMLGPSIYVLINMGARYVPCMKQLPNEPTDISWPCPWTTTANASDPMNHCTLSQLCGFDPVALPAIPNQWFRFIIPMFLHAGIIHITFNMLLQLTLGREMEKIIGSFRFLLVYLSSGIFGFVLGGNFASIGIASMGASGALFGIIAINLLDLLYTWKERQSPGKELTFILLDIVISFVLGLLPGLDNFSHIGGFLMGLVLGLCILHSPNALRERVIRNEAQAEIDPKKKKRRRAPRFDGIKEFIKDPVAFFKGRKGMWWAWWLVRAVALIGVLVSFILLLNNFYVNHNTCSWCKYLSCLPVKNWCDDFQFPNTTSNKRDLANIMRNGVDLGPFF